MGLASPLAIAVGRDLPHRRGGVSRLISRHNIQLRAEVRRTEAKAAEARRNYREARSAIQAMVARANDQRLAGTPKLLELRHTLQEDARGFYDRILAKTDANDPVVQADTANAFAEASMIETFLGHSDQAEKLVRRALDLIQTARAERPDDVEYLGIHAACLSGSQVSSTVRGGPIKPSSSVEKRSGWPNVVPMRRPTTCRTRTSSRSSRDARKRVPGIEAFEDALVPYRQAIAIRENIDPAKLPGVTPRLAGTLMNEGVMLWQQKKHSEADERFGRAETVLLSMSSDRRDATEEFKPRLCQLYMNWGGLLYESRRFEQAVSVIDKGLSRMDARLRIEPNDAGARQTCLKLHGNRGFALAAIGKHRESAGEWKRMVDLSTPPAPDDVQARLAIELLYADDLDAALAQAQLVQPVQSVSTPDRYNLACIFSRAAAAIRNDRGVSANQRAKRSAHISDALRWLKAAADAGFFRVPAQWDGARKDTDLEILRDLPEFRQLLDDHQPPAPAGSAPSAPSVPPAAVNSTGSATAASRTP